MLDNVCHLWAFSLKKKIDEGFGILFVLFFFLLSLIIGREKILIG